MPMKEDEPLEWKSENTGDVSKLDKVRLQEGRIKMKEKWRQIAYRKLEELDCDHSNWEDVEGLKRLATICCSDSETWVQLEEAHPE